MNLEEFKFDVVPVIATDNVVGCESCKHTGLVHMTKGQEHRYAYCSCPRGVSLSAVEFKQKNKKYRNREYLEKRNWRVYK